MPSSTPVRKFYGSASFASLASQATLTNENGLLPSPAAGDASGSSTRTSVGNEKPITTGSSISPTSGGDLQISNSKHCIATTTSADDDQEEEGIPTPTPLCLLDPVFPSHATAHTVTAACATVQAPLLPIAAADVVTMDSLSTQSKPMALQDKANATEHSYTDSPTASTYVAASSDPVKKRESIVLLLGECLLKNGCPGHRAEDALIQTARLFQLNCTFSLLPETILVTFHDTTSSTSHRQSIMINPPSGLDFGKIGEIQRVMDNFLSRRHRHENDEQWLDGCIESLAVILASPPTWGVKGTCFTYFVSSCTASVMLFNGSWKDMLLSGAMGLLVAGLTVLAGRRPVYGSVFEVSSSAFVSAIARAFHQHCCFSTVALSGILILLPGYTMTIAVMELSARRVTSGTIRLIYAVFIAIVLAYGFQIGARLYTSVAAVAGIVDSSNDADALCGKNPISPWFYIPLMPLLSMSIGMSYGSSLRQALPQFGGAIIAFCMCYFMAKVVPDMTIVGSTAAFAVGLYAHFALKLSKEPPLISMAVGITLLVPGSVGVRGAFGLLREQNEQLSSSNPTDILFPIRMLSISLGLAVGLFASAMIVYPAGKKRTLLLSL